jgi:hypothetical protein
MKCTRIIRQSPALVISVLALAVALGGTSYAAFEVPKNSVGTAQLKNHAVTGAKLKNNSITSGKLKNNSITSGKLKNNSVTGRKLAINTLPPVNTAKNADSAGFATNAGSASLAAVASALTSVTWVETTGLTSLSGTTTAGHAACPSGNYAVGGGAQLPPRGGLTINSSYPATTGSSLLPTEWRVEVTNTTGSSATFDAYVDCVPVSSGAGSIRRAAGR